MCALASDQAVLDDCNVQTAVRKSTRGLLAARAAADHNNVKRSHDWSLFADSERQDSFRSDSDSWSFACQ